MNETPASPAPGHFVTTRWSAIARAGGSDPAAAHAALSQLCQTYWYPLYAYARRQGHDPHESEDLTQEFFARLLEKNYVAAAQPDKGRFRAFLLTAFKGFMANDWDRRHARKRGGFQTHLTIDQAAAESRFNGQLAHQVQPDLLFERQWAITLLEQVTSRLEQEYTASRRARLFESLRPCLGRDDDAQPYAAIAAELNLTEAAVKTAVRRLRLRYREILREEIAQTVSTPEEIDEELRYLFATFAS